MLVRRNRIIKTPQRARLYAAVSHSCCTVKLLTNDTCGDQLIGRAGMAETHCSLISQTDPCIVLNPSVQFPFFTHPSSVLCQLSLSCHHHLSCSWSVPCASVSSEPTLLRQSALLMALSEDEELTDDTIMSAPHHGLFAPYVSPLVVPILLSDL